MCDFLKICFIRKRKLYLKRLPKDIMHIQGQPTMTHGQIWPCLCIVCNGHEFEQILGNGEEQGSLACCSPWGHKESDMT